MEAWQIEPCLLGYGSVGYLRTFLVVPSLMRMMFKPRLMPLPLFPSRLYMVSMPASPSVAISPMPVVEIGRIVPKLLQGDVALYESNDYSGT